MRRKPYGGFRNMKKINLSALVGKIEQIDRRSNQMKNILKRFLPLAVLIAIFCTLTSCNSKSEEAQRVDDLISALGSIDLESELSILEAEVAFNCLSDTDKKAVEGRKQLEDARNDFNELKANTVHDAIQRIGIVWGDNNLPDIQYARKEYDNLTEAQKALVDNYDDLVDAEEEYIRLKVEPVETLIQKISTFELDPESNVIPEGYSDAIDRAQEEFDNLPEEYQDKVSNLDELKNALECRSTRRVNNLTEYINEYCQNVDFDSGTILFVLQTAYDSLTDSEKARITNYTALQAAIEKYDSLQPIRLDSYRLGKDSIGDPELYLRATNVSDKIIKEFSVTVFAYDSDGVPVTVYFNDYSKGLRYGSAIKPGEKTKSNSYWTLYATYSEMKQVVVILRDVEFFDGTTWSNNKYGELVDKYEQQLLEDGDPNILTRS